MRRSTLLTLAALGGLVCLIGGTGLFAALSDTARGGTNSVESAPLPGSADIQIATATSTAGEPVTCGQFGENLTTAFYTVQNVSPGYNPPGVVYCVQNMGSQTVSLSVMADELVDLETACTGDEEAHGDTTCGGAGAPGELSSVIELNYARLINCDPNNFNGGPQGTKLDANATTPVQLGTLGPGLGQCFLINLAYPGGADPAIQRSQTDRVTWRFKWTGQA